MKNYLNRSVHSILPLILCLSISMSSLASDTSTIRKEALKEWKAMKFGLFIHWGIYSIPGGIWKGKQIEKLGEQIQRHAQIPHEEYAQLAAQFNPVLFNPAEIVGMAKAAGMKYVVLTAKHHDGFCMYDSKYTDFDIVDATPYKKDILKELADACRKHGLKLGLYYSNPDWHFDYPKVEINPDDNLISVFGKISKEHEDYEVNQLTELLTNYGDIVELFFDMGEPTLEQSQRFAHTVHTLQPACVINGRIMNNQGDFLTMPDNHLPEQPIDTLAWEMPGTFYHTWGYKSWVKGSPLPEQIKKQIRTLSKIASRGGNFLLNIGPKPDGSVVPYERDVLQGIAQWMQVHSEAIHATLPTPFVRLPWGECTVGQHKLYFHIFNWPASGRLFVPGLQSVVKKAYTLSHRNSSVPFVKVNGGYEFDLTTATPDSNLTVLAVDFEGELDIIDPIIQSDANGNFTLFGQEALSHEKYGRESYRSILKDYYRTWDIDVKLPGNYKVTLYYNMKLDNKKFTLGVEGQSPLCFELEGNNTAVSKVELIDGNEKQAVQRQVQDHPYRKCRKLTLGKLALLRKGRTTVKMGPGIEFVMKATTVEYKQQDPKYKSMNISIDRIVLEPM